MREYDCVIFYSGKVEVAKPSKTQKFLAPVYCCHLLVTFCSMTLYPLSYVTCIVNQELYPITYRTHRFFALFQYMCQFRLKYDPVVWKTNVFLRSRDSSVEIVSRLRFAQTMKRGSNSRMYKRLSSLHVFQA